MSAQAVVSKVFKALHSQQAALGIQVGDVKSSIKLAPMTRQELAALLRQAIKTSLCRAGWWALQEDQLLGCNFLDTVPGRIVECALVENLITAAELPSKILLIMEPSRYCQKYFFFLQ